jgi:excisionase family DNA binding protein
MAEHRILTVSELAGHLNVHRITIYRLLKSGSLPGFKIGRVWRFDLDEVGAWMQSGRAAREAIERAEAETNALANNGGNDGTPAAALAASSRGNSGARVRAKKRKH